MKKYILIIIGITLLVNTYTQEINEKEIKSEVNEVTVFLQGAQILRNKNIELDKGISVVKFVNLSPYIDAKSVQVKTKGELMVLSVNHQQNFINKAEKSKEIQVLDKRVEAIKEELEIEETHLYIIREELAFLKENRDIGGKYEQTKIDNLKETSDYYSSRLTSLKLEELQKNKRIKSLQKQKIDITNQIRTIATRKEYPTGEILVKVDAKLTKSFNFELSYFVGNVSWFPSYDLRAKSIKEPIQLNYKANIKQNTQVDWNNVKLKLSSADPNISGVAPRLQTYFLNYYTQAPSHIVSSNLIRGKVTDGNKVPLPGASIIVEGTTIGSITDMEGNYSITVPNTSSRLAYSYIGYLPQTLPISSEIMNVTLPEDMTTLDDVVVIGYGTSKKKEITGAVSSTDNFTSRAYSDFKNTLQGQVAGVSGSGQQANVQIRGIGSIPIPVDQRQKPTSVDFEIETPYSVKSDNKNNVVDVEHIKLPCSYQYYCVPKINRNAFLMANIVDWHKYNFLEGEANIFFEDTYVGKTLLDVRYASDTLEISLGPDKQVSVKRNKVENYTTSQLLGNRKEQTINWKIEVRNNKLDDIEMIVLDQVPVSTSEDIEVDVQNISNAKHHPATGEIKWKFELEPSAKKEMNLEYSVKYSKYMNLVLD